MGSNEKINFNFSKNGKVKFTDDSDYSDDSNTL